MPAPGEQLPLVDWLAQCGEAVALVFTDLVESTSLLYSQKTIDYTRMLRSHRQRAAALIRQQRGRLIDGTGDKHFAVFRTASQAYGFARDLFLAPGHPSLKIRAGVHYGAVRADASALVGRNVHLGARVMEHAAGSELWLSDAARRALESESPEIASAISWLHGEECALKGIPERQRLWRAG
jgi:class 3 adenylate cyclase